MKNSKKINEKLEKLANLLLTWELSELIEYRDYTESLKLNTFMNRLMLNVVIDEIEKR